MCWVLALAGLCFVHPSGGGLSRKQSPQRPWCESVFAGYQLYGNAKHEDSDGSSCRQPTPDEQLLGDHSSDRRGRGQCGFLGLQLVCRSLRPGDAREYNAVLRIHSRCEESGAVSLRAFQGLRGLLGGFCPRSESTLCAAQRSPALGRASVGPRVRKVRPTQGAPGCPRATPHHPPKPTLVITVFPITEGIPSVILHPRFMGLFLAYVTPWGPSWTPTPHPARCPAPGRTYAPLQHRGGGVSVGWSGWPHTGRGFAGGFGAWACLLQRWLGHSCTTLSLGREHSGFIWQFMVQENTTQQSQHVISREVHLAGNGTGR